jgi:REP element-mobilizing transposase RayT
VRSFKSAATRKINKLHKTLGAPFWQRGYYEHIIRNDKDLFEHRKYIQENPTKWALDEYYSSEAMVRLK